MAVVYKDDCVYTCDTPESPCGLDVCLECFIATSPDPEHNFTGAHHAQSGHAAFLNLRRVARPRAEPSEKPDKLVVKGEPEYDLVTKFKTLSSEPLSEANYTSKIRQVLDADSYAKTAEIDAWELELHPCEHVAILESLGDIKGQSSNLGKCGECHLTENLWLCLFCGHVSCGRPQFGGGGGNGHALEHFSTTKHALAVKLGSISPDGKADVYCYADDDEVADPQVSEHLARWGIDVSTRSKTEKSMTELQLEQNLNWDFSTVNGAEPMHGAGFTGMRNLGNTCYLNSVVQTLFDLPEFRSCFPPNRPDEASATSPATDLWTQLRKISDGLWSGRYEVISPDMLKVLIGRGHPEFASLRQQDAFEYWGRFTDQVSREARAHGVMDPTQELFGFATERRTECLECHAVRYVIEPQESLTVQVPIHRLPDEESKFEAVDFESLITPKLEQLEDYHCPGCHQTTTATTITGFKTFPQALVVNARRFEVVNWVPRKVDVPVVVPDTGVDLINTQSLGPQPGEHVVDDHFHVDPEALQILVGVGFPSEKAQAALEATENDTEAAMNKLLDPEFVANGGGSSSVSTESLSQLEAMGFTGKLAEAALRSTSSVEAAVEWLFEGHTEADAPPEAPPKADPTSLGLKTPGKYNLHSVICHKGTSVHVGHYVAAIKRGTQWFLFNDEHVTTGADIKDIQEFAYIYVLVRA